MSRDEVVITGAGVLGPFGVGWDALAAALAGAPPVPREVDRSAGYHRRHGARRALLVPDDAVAGLLPAAQTRRMSPPARLAVAATKLALAEARLDDPAAHLDTAIVAGTAFGPATVTEQLLRQILAAGPEQASPALFTESVASASAAQISMLWKVRGPVVAITQREASDLVALGEGVGLVATGRAARALVVVVEEMIPLLHAVLDRYRALARPDASGVEIARPLDRDRDGVLASDGALALVVERRAAAERRGVGARAAVLARGSAFDPSAPNRGFGSGATLLARATARSLERAGVDLASLDRVVSGAAGSRAGDALEGHWLATLFAGREAPPILVPKGALGAYGGGFLAAAVAVAEGLPAGPPVGFRTPDPALGVAPWTGGALPASHRLLVTGAASSGAAAWTVLAPV